MKQVRYSFHIFFGSFNIRKKTIQNNNNIQQQKRQSHKHLFKNEKKYKNIGHIMVLILDGNSEIGAHVCEISVI